MNYANRVAPPLAGILLLFDVASAAERRRPAVVDPNGRTIEVFTETGAVLASRPVVPAGAARSEAAIGEAHAECIPPAVEGLTVEARTSHANGITVDPCGRVTPGKAAVDERLATSAPLANPSIDRMTTRGTAYGDTYTPGGTLDLLGSAERYTLSDGSSWVSGAGTYYRYSTALDRVEISGSVIRYILFPPPYAGAIYQQTDFDSGDHSAQGTLAAAGPLVLEAIAGSAMATMKGNAVIVANNPTSYGEPHFNYYSAIVGSVVPFEQIYTLQGGDTWRPDTFTRSFTYSNTGAVDFAHPVSVPRAVELRIVGPAEVPDQSSIQFSAIVRYENDVMKNLTAKASWQVEPAVLATIESGLLTTSKLETPQETLILTAIYTEGDAVLNASKSVLCRAGGLVEGPGAWPMYQGNSRHTGYVPLSLEPAQASLRWQRNLGGGRALNPVTGAEGKVFATLSTYFNDVTSFFTLDALTGDTLWSKNLGALFSVNPPSTAYGTVYVQTGHSTSGSETSLRAYDAGTGDLIFQAPLSAQWERYYAPTVYDGRVYVNGGYYGGMYGLDAFSGEQKWFSTLPQYDQWTPAVAGDLSYAYVGSYSPGLYAVDRFSGRLAFVIADPDFAWNGWSMNLAPVVGAHDDVLAIHGRRLISFDTALHTIRWQLARNFVGQPSLAGGRIYAVDGTRLVVLDEQTGAELWSWQPPDGAPTGPMIVTDTHLLVSTATGVHAVDLATQQSVWSFEAAGALALADGNLYVASANGVLTAIAMPEPPGVLSRVEISGPSRVVEGSSAQYRAYAYYTDGRVADRTPVAEWSVEPSTYASIRPRGTMTTALLIRPAEDVVVRARYTEGDRTAEAALEVRLVIGVTVPELIRRNLRASIELKQQILSRLDQALEMERAALEQQSLAAVPAARESPPPPCPFPLLCSAIRVETHAARDVLRSIYLINASLAGIDTAVTPRPK